MLRATEGEERERYKAPLTSCGRFEDRGAGWFKAFGAWIAGKLRGLEEGHEGLEKETADLCSRPASEGKGDPKCVPTYRAVFIGVNDTTGLLTLGWRGH